MTLVASCKKVIRWWSESLDRSIPWYCRLAIKIHVGRCGPCARYQKQVLAMREMHRAAAGLDDAETVEGTPRLSDGRKEAIVQAMEQAG